MPTPLMPDEEFDAQFRQGLEHYPEQPETPAAWHRMELLLDADMRQQALRRKVWRLLGAETLLLLLGVWAILSLAVGYLPAASTSLTKLALTTRPAHLGTLGATRAARAARAAATASQPLTREKAGFLASAARPSMSASAQPQGAKSPLLESASRTRRVLAVAAPLGGRGPLRVRPARASTGRRQLLRATATKEDFGRLPTTNQLLASNLRHRSRPVGTATPGQAAARQRQMVLGQPQRPPAMRLAYALAGRGTRAGYPGRAATAAGATAAAILPTQSLPIDSLAPLVPAGDLSWHLPDSLALVGLALASPPADSLAPPRPTRPAYRLRLGVVAAPALSTVRADQLTAPGTSVGVQLDYQVGRRWRISTGYLATVSRYLARGTDYHLPSGYMLPHGWVIANVDAVCHLIDIPLNLRYDLWQRPRYQVFASVGLSSLLMRREQYTYDYAPSYGQPVPSYSWELSNGSRHVLQILNLSAGYERAVGPRWTVQAEPFVKLPLGGIGYGAVRLSSAGIFFSLKYGLLPVHPAPPH